MSRVIGSAMEKPTARLVPSEVEGKALVVATSHSVLGTAA